MARSRWPAQIAFTAPVSGAALIEDYSSRCPVWTLDRFMTRVKISAGERLVQARYDRNRSC